MTPSQTICYFGNDTELLSFLRSTDALNEYELDCRDEDLPLRSTRTASCVALIDLNVAEPEGLQLLHALTWEDRSIPVIVVVDVHSDRLMTQIANARQNGAEGVVYKPLTDIDLLATQVRAAFDKLARWRATLIHFLEKQHGGTFPASDASVAAIGTHR